MVNEMSYSHSTSDISMSLPCSAVTAFFPFLILATISAYLAFFMVNSDPSDGWAGGSVCSTYKPDETGYEHNPIWLLEDDSDINHYKICEKHGAGNIITLSSPPATSAHLPLQQSHVTHIVSVNTLLLNLPNLMLAPFDNNPYHRT